MRDPASADLDRAATSQSARARVLMGEAEVLRLDGRWQEALPLLFEAHKVDPTNPAALHNLGVLLSKAGRLNEAEAALRRALTLAPQSPIIEHGLAHALLAQGKYKEGWLLYRAREHLSELNTGFPRDFPFPRWEGQPLDGKRLTIFPEQGLGDQIQFARFLPRLIADAGIVTLLTMKPLERLFRHNFPEAEVIVAEGAVEFPDPDYWTTPHDLMRVLGIEPNDVPTDAYLTTPATWPSPGAGFKVGLKTKGNPRHVNDKLRSLPDDAATRLRDSLPGLVVSLEPEDSGAQDMADTAALIEQLDLVVSVDTSVAHLAGALGKSCLLLIPGFSRDWRWMVGRSDSIWYSRHRLYRSGLDGDWTPAIDRLVADVRRFDTPGRSLMREALALRDEGRFLEALAIGQKALAVDSKNPYALHNVARLLTDLGRLRDGERLQRRAVALAPDKPEMRYGLGLNLLAQGRFRDAWPYYEARTELPHLGTGFPARVAFPRWQGEDISGKRIAIFPEQGMGDAIQFARFIPWLRGRCAGIVLLAPTPLMDLFQLAFPDVTVVAAAGAASFPKCEVWTTIVDMARHCDIATDALPSGNYLQQSFPPPDAQPGWRIGIMTRGNPAYIHNVHRSLPETAANALRRQLPGRLMELDPVISGARTFLDTARMIAHLDLVVSVDTSVGHLAGAMGKPCLLLVNGFATDWRWMRGRDDSPWYPAHRLFRSEIGSWDDAIRRLTDYAKTLSATAALPL